jgi:hypothetical protein
LHSYYMSCPSEPGYPNCCYQVSLIIQTIFPTHSSRNISTHEPDYVFVSMQITLQGQKFDPKISQLFQQGKGQWWGLLAKQHFRINTAPDGPFLITWQSIGRYWQPLLLRLARLTYRKSFRPHSHCRPNRAERNRTELSRVERVTIPIANQAGPNRKHCSWHFLTAGMSNQVHVFSLMDNIWWISLLFTKKRCFWMHMHFNPRKLDLLRNRIGLRLASKNKHQPGNTLGQARSGSAWFGVQCECFYIIG